MSTIVNMRDRPDLRRQLEGCAEHAGVVRIDRRTRWGNKFVIGRHGSREQVIARYRTDLWRRIHSGEIALEDLAGLSTKTLACWCRPSLPCHGDVLARAAAWAARELAAAVADDAPILFWSRCPDWSWLSNFAAADFGDRDGRVWKTAEHWYQAGKPADPAAADRIRLVDTPHQALRLGRAAPCRPDWESRKIPHMAEGLLLRFAPDLPDTARLLATGDRPLRHATPWGRRGDPFWGIGRDGTGSNLLGLMIETVRAARRAGQPLDAAALVARIRQTTASSHTARSAGA